MTLTGTTITGNRGTHSGGGILINGGLIVGGTISENSATPSGTDSGGGGAGIYSRGHLTLRASTVHANRSTTTGGGVESERGLVLDSSTVNENTSQGRGAGVFGSDPMTLTNSTVSGNVAAADGGGVTALSLLTITHSTITDNHSTAGRAGGVFAWFLDVRAFSSIIAGNTAANGNPDLHSGNNTYAIHYSLVGDAAGTPLIEAHTPDASGNLIGNSAGTGRIDPKLAPLAYNGGPTRTRALLAGSPAIDANRFQPAPAPSHVREIRHEFGPNQGVNLSSELANPAHYSIEIVFTWHALSGGWQKIIDFHNLNSNVGLYTASNGLHFLNGPFKANLFEPSTFNQLVLTRDDVTDVVNAYIDGVQVWSFTDTAGDAVFDGPNQIIRFFRDDNVTGRREAQSGTVDLIRLYDAPLTATQVAFLENSIVLPAFDVARCAIRRVRDGDGIGGAQIDLGAFELQTFPAPVAIDFGDAPDLSVGTETGNYRTLPADNGPSHGIVAGLRIGTTVDGDSGTLQSTAANADDIDALPSDDEDGVINAAAGLVLTTGVQPALRVRVTNTTATTATLYGWIDYNADGVFDNATERLSCSPHWYE